MKTPSFPFVLSALAVFACTGPAWGYSSGINGRATTGCNCHSAGQAADTTTGIAAPATMLPGQGGDVTVTVSRADGGTRGGFNLRASAGSVTPLPGDTTVRKWAASEVSHANPLQRAWTVGWAPPAVPSLCSFRLNAAANAVNGNATADPGDHWDLATTTIVVDQSGDAAAPLAEFRVPKAGDAYVFGGSVGAIGTTLVAGPIQLAIVATDDTGIASVHVSDTDAFGTSSIGQAGWAGLTDGGTRNLFRLNWDTAVEPPGSHTLTVVVTDCADQAVTIELEVVVL